MEDGMDPGEGTQENAVVTKVENPRAAVCVCVRAHVCVCVRVCACLCVCVLLFFLVICTAFVSDHFLVPC